MTIQCSDKSFQCSAKYVVLVVLFGVFGTFVCSARTPNHHQTLRLGGLWKHEKLQLFKARFPHSICGTPLDYEHVNRHTLDDPDNSEWLMCCIDEPNEVSAFSRFTVLSRDHNSPVLISFYQGRLNDIFFAVDASSVATVLPEFVKVYGPIHHETIIETETVPVRFATWMYHDVTLELSEELLKVNDFEIVPPPSDRSPKARIVLFTLF